MKLYKFDPITREYICEINAMENPKLPGRYLAMSYTTMDKIPSLAANEAVFRSTDNSKWQIMEDYRGCAWKKETKEQVEISDLGPLDETLTKLEPSEFDVWGSNQWISDEKALLSSTKATTIEKVASFANQCRRKIAGDVDHLETAEWSEKRLRALRISNSEALPGDVEKIETEALYREKGETVNELVAKIITNANRYENASIIITGMTAAAIEAINKAETDEAITSLLEALKVKAELELAKL
jgi:hypothetical protein